MLQPNPVVKIRKPGHQLAPTKIRPINPTVGREIFQGDTGAAAVRFFWFLPSADMCLAWAYCDMSFCGLVDHDKHLIRQHFFG